MDLVVRVFVLILVHALPRWCSYVVRVGPVKAEAGVKSRSLVSSGMRIYRLDSLLIRP